MAGHGLGATLLFPYFEVDLDDPEGISTLISVNNGLDSPGMARVVMWTDWGVPTLAFDLYLRAFDIQSINLRSIFHGFIPSTGEGSVLDDYPFCVVSPPYHANPAVSPERIEQLRAVHTGKPGPVDGHCYGADHGDSIARGYVTVDSVVSCSGLETFNPKNQPAGLTPIYFDDGGLGGIADNRNFLWGDTVFLDGRNDAAQGMTAVSVWADPGGIAQGKYTFYGSYRDWNAKDDRVPLPTEWVQRFFNGGSFAGGTDLIVFRQANHGEAVPRSCDDPPGWFSLQSTVTSMDEDGGRLVTHAPDTFALASQRVSIGDLEPAPSASFGLVRIVGDADQLWVQPVLTGLGRFGVGLDGSPLRTLCGSSPPSADE
jgi:hypothetical protein